jgi:hypothetical protein
MIIRPIETLIWKAKNFQTESARAQSLEKVKSLAKEKKLCLFVGRAANEPIPESTEAEEWVSLDILKISPAEKNPKSLNRLHLVMDCNDPESLGKIQGLFDRVVVDGSTLKLIQGNPWETMGKLLKASPESELITECCKGSGPCYTDDDEEPTNTDGALLIPMKALATGTLQEVNRRYTKASQDRAVKHLQELFDEVILEKDKPYPYPNRWNVRNFFVLKGPKRALHT